MFRKDLVRLELTIWFCASIIFLGFAPSTEAQEGDLFAAPTELVRPIPPEGRSVLYLLHTLSENYQFELKTAPGTRLDSLQAYTFKGKIEGLPLRAAIEKVIRDSGASGVTCRFQGETVTIAGNPGNVPLRAENKPTAPTEAPAPKPVQAEPNLVAPAALQEQAERPSVPVNRRFTQPDTVRPHYQETTPVLPPVYSTRPAYGGGYYARPVNAQSGRMSFGDLLHAVQYGGAGAPNYYNSAWASSPGYYGGYGYSGYVNPLITAEWCANFPANRLCTHGVIKIDSPELRDVDMYLTPLDPSGTPVAPRSNLGPVSKHNSVFNKGYYAPVGFYRVEFINKGKSILLFEDNIRVEASYVNDGHPQVYRVDKNRFLNEPIRIELEREEPRRKTVDEWRDDK